MLILGVDTSGKHGSISLVRCEYNGRQVIEVVPLQGGTFSAQLVPEIAALLEKRGFKKDQIDGFAVVSGPGSFTGLRVGLAAIKGLAEVLEKPIAAVSLLEAVARSKQAGRVVSALDAGRGEIYVGRYDIRDGHVDCLNEELLSREELVERVGNEVVITPDASIAEALQALRNGFELVERPKSDVIAGIGCNKIRSGQTVSPEDLEANYIRRSDAERGRK